MGQSRLVAVMHEEVHVH